MTSRIEAAEDIIVDALGEALAYFNVQAQRSFLSLSEEEDDIRQKIATALSLIKGNIFIGNLQRGDEIKAELEKLEEKLEQENHPWG